MATRGIVSCPTRWSLYWPLALCIDHLSLLSTERRGTAMYYKRRHTYQYFPSAWGVFVTTTDVYSTTSEAEPGPEDCHLIWLTGARGWRIGLYTGARLSQGECPNSCMMLRNKTFTIWQTRRRKKAFWNILERMDPIVKNSLKFWSASHQFLLLFWRKELRYLNPKWF